MNNAKLDPNVGTFTTTSPSLGNSVYSKLLSNTNVPPPETVIAPPSLYLLLVREHLNPSIEVAAQNVFDKPSGAFTGEISVLQLQDSNITWTILGHSERRTILGETDDVVASKTKFATDSGIGVIWCCGETLEEREAGKTLDVITTQLAALHARIGDA